MLKREAEGLDYLPYPGELGKRIYASISKEAWAQWVAHQTMLINENRLTPIEPKARAFLVAEMEKFLFGERVGEAEGIRAEVGPTAVSGGPRVCAYLVLRGSYHTASMLWPSGSKTKAA